MLVGLVAPDRAGGRRGRPLAVVAENLPASSLRIDKQSRPRQANDVPLPQHLIPRIQIDLAYIRSLARCLEKQHAMVVEKRAVFHFERGKRLTDDADMDRLAI